MSLLTVLIYRSPMVDISPLINFKGGMGNDFYSFNSKHFSNTNVMNLQPWILVKNK